MQRVSFCVFDFVTERNLFAMLRVWGLFFIAE